AGEVVGPWCLSLAGPAPPAETRSALRDILARQRADNVWSAIGQPSVPRPRRWTSAEGTDLPYYLLGLALVLGPFTLGWLLGLAFLRLASGRVRPVHFTVAVVTLSGGALVGLDAGEVLRVSIWDEASFLALLSLGAGIAAHAGTTRAAGAKAALLIA